MRRKFKLIDEKSQNLATVLYFFEDQINQNVGIIISNDLRNHLIWLYKNEGIKDIIEDLAGRLSIQYKSYDEVSE